MAISAEFSRFTGAYLAKNGPQLVKVRPLSLARAMISVGYQDLFHAINEVGPLRAISIAAASAGFFAGKLRTTAVFDSLETTEKVGVTFLAASGLTLLAAEQQLQMRHLIHFTSWKGVSPVPTAAHSVSKSKMKLSDKSKSRPDFVGYDQNDGVHVFESKGRSATKASAAIHSDTTLQKALAQVGRVASVQGQAPLTRLACLWSLGTDTISGRVVDPEQEVDAVDLRFDRREALLRSYAAVLGDWFEQRQRPLDGEFVGVEILPGVDLIVDRQVFDILMVLKRTRGPSEAIDLLLSRTAATHEFDDELARSVGANGVGMSVREGSAFFDALVE
jgi:hypothetical protein